MWHSCKCFNYQTYGLVSKYYITGMYLPWQIKPVFCNMAMQDWPSESIISVPVLNAVTVSHPNWWLQNQDSGHFLISVQTTHGLLQLLIESQKHVWQLTKAVCLQQQQQHSEQSKAFCKAYEEPAINRDGKTERDLVYACSQLKSDGAGRGLRRTPNRIQWPTTTIHSIIQGICTHMQLGGRPD